MPTAQCDCRLFDLHHYRNKKTEPDGGVTSLHSGNSVVDVVTCRDMIFMFSARNATKNIPWAWFFA
jgi:hypothetical protein